MKIMKDDSISFVTPTLPVKRECLCIEGTIFTEDLGLSLLPSQYAQTASSFWINELSTVFYY